MTGYGNIPEILTVRPNWVVWGIVGEPEKVPFSPHRLLRFDAVPAKSGIPETWGSFAEAAACVGRGLALGIGYEFDGCGIYGVDLDNVIVNGVIRPEARKIVEELNSYSEISPSGRGLHIYITAQGAEITRHRKQGGFVEIYSKARYFTVTGNVYGGYDRIADRPAELQSLHDRYFLPEPSKAVTPVYAVESARGAEDALRRGLQKDAVLRACWNGERRRGDESADDIALMNKLAYWLSADQSAMCAAFTRSPYYAQKDEAHQKKCRRADYLPNTAKAACAALRSTEREDTARYRRERSRGDAR
jgi:putative DNA primase/helicase